MTAMYDEFSAIDTPKISQVTGTPSAKSLATLDQVIVVVPLRPPSSVWKRLPQGALLRTLLRRRRSGNVPAISTRLSNRRNTALHLVLFDAEADTFGQLSTARKAIQCVRSEKAGALGLWVLGFEPALNAAIAGQLAAASLAAQFPLPAYREKPADALIRQLKILGQDDRLDLRRVQAEASGNNLARWLTAQPANKLDAGTYVAFLKKLASARGWQSRVFGVQALTKMGAGAFLAVAQGNQDNSAAIVRLRYRPPGATDRLALVGKGIVFDTGGTNLKPFNSMLDMHIDMGGSAVAVGTMLAISELELPVEVDCWLAITENRTGPAAYKPQDVVTALNGKTIKIVHTDAEGRMALADTLVLASREKPVAIIDYATLTGACMNAVTTRYSGVFTNRPALHPVLRKCGVQSGERVWPFPVGREFLEELKSETADLLQCSPDAGGDHILAASFLAEFVGDDVPWIHVDLSACKRKGGLAHIPTDITGFGVRLSMQLLIDSDLLGKLRSADGE